MAHHSSALSAVVAPRSRFYQGPFGRLCPDLPAWSPPGVAPQDVEDFFFAFATERMVELPGVSPGEIAADSARTRALSKEFGTGDDADPSTGIPAAYTYFGQFIDHDVTFDPTPLNMRNIDPERLLNFRTPRLDLDNVYGRGPADQPYLYDKNDRAKLQIGAIRLPEEEQKDDCVRFGKLRDLPRDMNGVALIGDMRNDENSIVSQLQLAFMLAHNTLVDRARAKGHDDPFESARRTLRWLYQWIVWHDFIQRVTIDEVQSCALSLEKTCGGMQRWDCGLDFVYNWKSQPFMPVEFSAAAYRFGHSMVRNGYQTNAPHRGFDIFAPIFDNSGGHPPGGPDDLRGFRPMLARNVIQWDWFLKMRTSGGPFPQRARKIDTKLANALAFLFEGMTGERGNVLAFRNLLRGHSLGLPSGAAMARKYCIKEVSLKEGEPESLWYYILREAETLPGKNAGQMLGRLGSVIVCATFAGLLKGDPHSWLNVDPCWTPDQDDLLCSGQDNQDADDGAWELSSIIRLAGLPVNDDDVSAQTEGEFPDVATCGA